MARPVKQSDDRRAARRVVRLTAAEEAAFKARAKAAGLSPIEFHRQALLEGRILVRRTAEADPAVIAQLIRIGTNLNQIARTANATGRVPDNLDRLCRMVEEIVMRAVGKEEAGAEGEGAEEGKGGADGADDRQLG